MHRIARPLLETIPTDRFDRTDQDSQLMVAPEMSEVDRQARGRRAAVGSGLCRGSVIALAISLLWQSRPSLADGQADVPPPVEVDQVTVPMPGATAPARPPQGQVGRRTRDARLESDDWTFRPTVLVRRGTSQGSGTIIASVDGETLIATAAHVIRGSGPVTVELHRYNLGLEQHPIGAGRWPRHVPAEPVASDPSADVAILRVRKLLALPFTARLLPENEDLPTKAGLTSVGIDLGSKLSSWDTSLEETLWFELNDSGADRPFLITARIPEHGRSGGGLYDGKGRLVAICVGHAELVKGQRMGIFSSLENVRQLLTAHELTPVLTRSEARHARLVHHAASPRTPLSRPSRPAVTPTEASGEAAGRQP
jgi:hypothetical protein